ncbi:MAG: hypothetical protein QOF69_2477 [Solirubrobacteraceae bacterium]|nr:hypothetical protein [Solirubrobacteraceae bacterium]
MGPEPVLLFVVLIVAVLGGGALYAIRAGLWFNKVDPDAPEVQADKALRPAHTVVDNETADRLMTPEETAPRDVDDRSA